MEKKEKIIKAVAACSDFCCGECPYQHLDDQTYKMRCIHTLMTDVNELLKGYQDFNINNYVKVKLTEKGKYIYYHQYDDMNDEILKMGGKPLNPIELKYDDDGYVEFQMWHLMEIFGKHLYNGCDVPFYPTIKLKLEN